jgi:hypothetical protein
MMWTSCMCIEFILVGTNYLVCRGLVPQIPRETGYGLTNQDTTMFPPAENG